nr:hypothetical protein [Tanacetum cinerariifolium]
MSNIEQWAYLRTHPSKRLTSFCYDDDDDDEDYTYAITPNEPVLSTEEPDNSLSMRDEHLDTIPATKSDEFIKFGVETLITIPSESKGIPQHKCDVPFHDNSLPLDVSKDQFEDLFESNEEFSLTDNDSFSFDNIDYVEASPPNYELVSSEVDAFLAVKDEFPSSQFPKLYLNPEGDMLLLEAFLYDDHSFDFKTKSSSTFLNSLLEETNNFNNSLLEFTTFSNVLCDAEYESDSSDDQSCSDEDVLETIISKPLSEEEIIPMKSLRTYDSSLPISSKIDSLLDEFAGELTLLKSIPPGIDETDCDFEEDIRLIEKFCTITLLCDSDFLMEEIDLFCTPNYPMPLGIEDKDYDSERDILIPKDLPRNNTEGNDGDSFLEKFKITPRLETFKFDIEEKNSGSTTIHDDISLSDIECFYFKSEPDPRDLTSIIDPGIHENISSTTNVNLPFEDDQSPLFTYNILSATNVNLPFEDNQSPLFAYVAWIFLPFLTYPVAPPYLLSSGNEDTIFDHGISIYHSIMLGVSH